MLAMARRTLTHKVSVVTMIEIALWLAIPHAIIGIGWGLFHPDHLVQRAKQLSTVLPGGVDAKLVAFGETSLWWPVLMLLPPDLCTESNDDAMSPDISARQSTDTVEIEPLADRAVQISAPGVGASRPP